MRLGFLIECVVASAVGMWLVRQSARPYEDIEYFASPAHYLLWESGRYAMAASCGAGLVLGLGTWLERARRRGPEVWGIGRWGLSVLSANMIIRTFFLHLRIRPSHFWSLGEWFEAILDPSWDPDFAWALVAVAITYWIVPRSPTGTADAREWTGRVVSVLCVLASGFQSIGGVLGVWAPLRGKF